MRTFLTTPAWALGLLTGLPVAVVTAFLVALSGDTVTFALTLGATIGLLFGIAMALGAVWSASPPAKARPPSSRPSAPRPSNWSTSASATPGASARQ